MLGLEWNGRTCSDKRPRSELLTATLCTKHRIAPCTSSSPGEPFPFALEVSCRELRSEARSEVAPGLDVKQLSRDRKRSSHWGSIRCLVLKVAVQETAPGLNEDTKNLIEPQSELLLLSLDTKPLANEAPGA